MNMPILTNIVFRGGSKQGIQPGSMPEIIFAWSNARHHSVVIDPPYGKEKVADALRQAHRLIMDDEMLEPGD
jgi:hypothetical protein